MITAILDTNVFIRAAIRYPDTASSRVVDAYLDGNYRLILSYATLDELLTVLLLPRIRVRHGWSDQEILGFLTRLPAGAITYPGRSHVATSITRDVSDTKFLALAQESSANYLVTTDRRHLIRLKRYKQTRIVTPAAFLRLLPAAPN